MQNRRALPLGQHTSDSSRVTVEIMANTAPTRSVPACPGPPTALPRSTTKRQGPSSSISSATEGKRNTIQSQVRVTQICHCDELMEWLHSEATSFQSDGRFCVADYGPGWNPEAPIFVGRELQLQLSEWARRNGKAEVSLARPLVYALDLHEVRLINLFNAASSEGLEDTVRCVHCRLETMATSARFVPNQEQYLLEVRIAEVNPPVKV